MDREPGPVAFQYGAPAAALTDDEQQAFQRLARRQRAVALWHRHQGSDPLPLRVIQFHVLCWPGRRLTPTLWSNPDFEQIRAGLAGAC